PRRPGTRPAPRPRTPRRSPRSRPPAARFPGRGWGLRAAPSAPRRRRPRRRAPAAASGTGRTAARSAPRGAARVRARPRGGRRRGGRGGGAGDGAWMRGVSEAPEPSRFRRPPQGSQATRAPFLSRDDGRQGSEGRGQRAGGRETSPTSALAPRPTDRGPSQPPEGGAGTLFQRLVVVELGLVVEGGAVGAAGGLGVPHLLVHLADVVLAPRPPLGEGVAGVRDGDAVVADGLVPRPQRLVGAA